MTVTKQPYADDFYDVPAQKPAVGIALDRVGVHGQRVLLDVADELFGGVRELLCDARAEVSLAAGQRGIHMSRIEGAFVNAPGALPLAVIASAIAREVRDTQTQESARVTLRAFAPLRTRTRVTGLASPDTVEVAAVAVAGPRPSAGLSLAATNITACPCMQGYALSELVGELGLGPDEGRRLMERVPIATHSQKGRVRVEVTAPDARRLPDYAFLHRLLSGQTTLTQELLKRPDEYDLVRRSHLRPQFVEDVVRGVAEGLARGLAESAPDLEDVELDVSAESYESIHGHDISAQLRIPATALLAELSPLK
ncbi:GTP cyclohydrolase, FolE2/MptA family [Nonomuraea sp. NPDC059007]|uniref:GTP cyclohydrolase, FolE2/MptA family n=1 Tax=Nonomuraea sp. NPDC059007 TaxID=3346692 RepID=UPI0036C94DBA